MRDALRELPVRDLLFDERGELRPLVNVYVDSVQADDLEAPLSRRREIRLVAASPAADAPRAHASARDRAERPVDLGRRVEDARGKPGVARCE